MRRLARMAAWAAAAAVGVAAPARADLGDYLGKRISVVRLDIEGRAATEPRLLDVVETRAGQPLSMVQVRESIVHLYSFGRFEDVRVHATLEAGAVALRYELVPVHPVAKIEFAGRLDAPGVDEGRLRQVVFDRYGASPPLGRAGEVAKLVAGELRHHGYLGALVTPHADIRHAPDRAILTFTIEPGDRTAIGKVDVAGTPMASMADLLDRLKLAPGRPYEREALNARIDGYIAGLKKRGYYEARVDPIVQLADQDRVADLTLNVQPGPHVKVVFAGDPLPSDRRDDLVPIAREGSTDEDLLEDSTNRIEDYLKAQGYREAIAPHTREEADGELLITFTVHRGAQYRVASMNVAGNTSIPLSEFADNLRLRAGQPFSASKLDADVAMLEDLYRRRGFASAKVQGATERETGDAVAPQIPILVRITVREGVRTIVGDLKFDGLHALSDAALREGLALLPGKPFITAQLPVDRDAIQLKYANAGYPSASVEVKPQFSADGTRASLAYTVREGPKVIVDHILVVGNVRTRTETIVRELQLASGNPLSLSAIAESQRRLAALGLFRRARITELRHGDENSRDLLVTVEEAPVTTIGYGAGAEVQVRVVSSAAENGAAVQQLELAPRGSVDIGRRNLFGKNRSVNFFASLSLYPKDAGLAEYRVLSTYREPRVFNTTADAFVTGVVEQQIRSSFNFARRSVSAEVGRHLTRLISVAGSYSLQSTRVFDEQLRAADQPLVDRLFPQVRLSSFIGSLIRDTRNDPTDPSSGLYLSANGQLAARTIGSEVGFAKSFMTAQAFRIVPRTNHVVFAGAARLGLADALPREVLTSAGTVETIQELPPSERFFAGGDTTVRGFALDTLGSPQTLDVNGFPIGGNALVILNAELRVPVRGGLGVVGFVDTGNVFAFARDIDLGEFRTAVGFGIRYKSPVGPLRIDIGFKIRPQTIVPGQRERLTALHISFGQAF